MSGEAGMVVEVDGPDAAAVWRRAFEDEATARLFSMIGPESGFSGRHAVAHIGGGLVADVRARPLHLRDDASATADQAPVVLLQAVVEGRPIYQSAAGEVQTLRPGQLVIRKRDPAALIRSERFAHVTTVAVPLHVLTPRYGAAAALLAGAVFADDSLPPRLLYGFIAGLADVEDIAERQNGRFVEALGGLVALVLAQTPQPPAALSDIAASRASEILGYLQRNFSNPQLAPQTLADDLSISVRYAHKLMRLTGRSFREALIGLRLDAARLAFAANRRPRQTIGEIAISVGFNDLSQFNRHFRRAFGMTPRAARRLDEAYGYESCASGIAGEFGAGPSLAPRQSAL